MIGQREALHLFGREVFDPRGRRVGIVGQLFLEEDTEQPAWVTVETGLFGTYERFVPLEGAAFDGDTLTVAVLRLAIRQSPLVRLDQGNLPLEEEQALYLHYGRNHGLWPADSGLGGESSGPVPECVQAVRVRLRHWAAAV